ncbi:MAG TPA: hypothetical protein VGL50_03570 [Steroidobacteraceae bacterium]|jgi:hypothetical protein
MNGMVGMALGILIAAVVLGLIIWQVRTSRPRRKGASSTNAPR